MTFLLIQEKQAKLLCQPELNLSRLYGNHQLLLSCGSSLTQRWWLSRGKNLHRGAPTTAITAQVKYLDWNFRCNFSLPTSRGLYRYNLQVQNTLGKQWTSNAHCPLLATSWKLKSNYRRIIRAPAAGISIMLSRCSPSLPRSPHLSVSLTSVWEHTAETSGNSQDTTDVRAAAANTQHNNEKSPLLTWQKEMTGVNIPKVCVAVTTSRWHSCTELEGGGAGTDHRCHP